MSEPAEPAEPWPDCALWDWAVRTYGHPGVADTCLDFQDQGGHDVILVLFALWLGGRGIALDDDLAERTRDAVAPFCEEVVRPLRSVRRRLKARLAAPGGGPETHHPERVAALRERIKRLELEAERLEILTLAALVEGTAPSAPPSPGLGRANLERLVALSDEDRARLADLQARLAAPPA